MIPRRALVLAAMAPAFAVGCGLTLTFGPAVVNRCSVQTDCGSGECVEGACITTSLDPSMAVVFEVVPAPDGLLPARAPVVFAPVEVAAPMPVDLALPPEMIVSGGAFFGAVALRVPVHVTFTPRPGFDGAPGSQVRVTSDADDYAVLLEAGNVYDVVVEPTGVAIAGLAEMLDVPGGPPASQIFPPLYIEGVGPEIIGTGILDFAYPDDLFLPCTAEIHDGCTLGGHVRSVDVEGSESYESGLLVRAVDAAGRVVSSSTLTDESGAFFVRIMPGAEVYELRVTPPEDVPLPSIEIAVDFELPASDREIALPRLTAVPLQNYVGYYVDGVPFAVDHAAVAFQSIELDDLGLPGELSFRRTAFTETPASGPSPFTLSVFPGMYRVIVTPAESDRAGVLVFEVDIDERSAEPGITGQNYLVPLRTRVSGAVRTPRGEAVPFAGLRARRVAAPSSLDAGDIGRFARSSEATADALGGYVLPLDVGTFDLVVRPGEGTGYAWQVVPGVRVEAGQGDFSLDVSIVPPVPVTGVAIDAAGEPLASALVRAYVLVGIGEERRAVQVGEATTDDGGAYEVLLPGGL